MDDLHIDSDPAASDLQNLEARIYEFNVAATGYDDGEYLSIFLKDDAGGLRAGLSGHTWGGCCEIKLLWICDDERGRGLGERMLQAAENEARRRGCVQITLSSHSFQAPDFYRKQGYRDVFSIADYPRAHANLHFVKAL